MIHFHIDHLHFPLARRSGVTNLTTLHGRLDLPDLAPLFREFADLPLVSISNAQRAPLPWPNWIDTVYHGLAFMEALWPHVERALAWMEDAGDRDGDGFIEYERATERGLAQQGWKDARRRQAPVTRPLVQPRALSGHRHQRHAARGAGRGGGGRVARDTRVVASATVFATPAPNVDGPIHAFPRGPTTSRPLVNVPSVAGSIARDPTL